MPLFFYRQQNFIKIGQRVYRDGQTLNTIKDLKHREGPKRKKRKKKEKLIRVG